MDYKIKNVQQTIDNSLIEKARGIISKVIETGILTDQQENSLLKEASIDGNVSEEEIKFIAGFSNKENIQKIKSVDFNPVNNEINFNNVSENNLNRLRDKVQTEPNKYQSKSTSIEKIMKSNPKLRPLFNALNDKSLTKEQRLKLIETYQSEVGSKIASLKGWSNGLLNYNPNPLNSINQKADSIFNYESKVEQTREEHKYEHKNKLIKGVYKFFYEESTKEPTKSIIFKLSESIVSDDIKTPQQLFQKAKSFSKGSSEKALKAVACIMNSVHTGFLSDEKTEDFGRLVQKAYIKLNLNRDDAKGVGSIMSHNVRNLNEKGDKGVKQDFTSDNNMHFWVHACLSYETLSKGGSEDDARGFSAYIGSEYEIKAIDENNGNSGIKDIIINAYGAEFGIKLFNNDNTQLPKSTEGPQIENKVDFK